jgi:hypothetical protein
MAVGNCPVPEGGRVVKVDNFPFLLPSPLTDNYVRRGQGTVHVRTPQSMPGALRWYRSELQKSGWKESQEIARQAMPEGPYEFHQIGEKGMNIPDRTLFLRVYQDAQGVLVKVTLEQALPLDAVGWDLGYWHAHAWIGPCLMFQSDLPAKIFGTPGAVLIALLF